MKLSKQHRKNLALAADVLDEVDPTYFSMARYAIKNGRQLELDEIICGSVCCGLGSLPGKRPEFEPKRGETWFTYSARLFGMDADTDIKPRLAAWRWIFGEKWAKVDNTPKGPAARIRYFLEQGLPDDWEAQMNGRAPICY